MIKAVIFDIDGVLMDSFEAGLDFYKSLMITTGYRQPTRKEFRAMFHLTMMDAIKTMTKSGSEEEIERIFKIGQGRKVSYKLRLLRYPKGMNETMRELHKNYLLGIATSRVKQNVYESPVLKKLKKYFQVAASFQDTVKHKPDPEPLFFAAKKLGVKPGECVYIGDTESDLKAARAAGMKMIAFSKTKLKEADASTYDFKKLPEIIKKLK